MKMVSLEKFDYNFWLALTEAEINFILNSLRVNSIECIQLQSKIREQLQKQQATLNVRLDESFNTGC